MKSLATCSPREFLKQTNLIRKSVSKWLTDTDILNIRKRTPQLSADATEEEKKGAIREQARKNLDAMLDAMLEEHPDETLEVLALTCFIDPKEIDNYTMIELLEPITEMMNNSTVLSFFTSLIQLANQIS